MLLSGAVAYASGRPVASPWVDRAHDASGVYVWASRRTPTCELAGRVLLHAASAHAVAVAFSNGQLCIFLGETTPKAYTRGLRLIWSDGLLAN
jgi:hypothetical protein